MEKVAIVDYGMSNLHSVHSALKQVANNQFEIEICQNAEQIENADRIVFPGQGAAADCMHQIDNFQLANPIKKAASEKPFLGICMGMQVLLNYSEENEGTDCLGLIEGSVNRFEIQDASLKVPHMGWNTIQQRNDHPLWHDIPQDSYYYFVHSYYVQLENMSQAAGITDYGIEFTSVLAQGKVFAMQCHPEKSADNGLQLLTNFLNWNGS
ncbi:MAG: imidazole glycerol phosphate synthase subunit HisH [Pseudomonadota bacterium]